MTVENGDVEGKHTNYKHDNGKHWPQVLAILAVSLGSFTCGVMLVWTSPSILVITQDKENYDITEEEASYFIVFQPLGMIASSFFLFKLTELLGRKRSVQLVAVPQIATWVVTIFARTKWHFYAAMFIAGIGESCVFCSIPSYVGEITTPRVRGLWGNAPTFILYAGQLFITVIGSYLDVQTTSYVSIGIPILFLALVSLLPESPYQLIKDGSDDDARKAIKWLKRKTDVEEEFKKMKADVDRQLSETGNWKDLFTIDSNQKALRAGAFLRFSQQFCGISVVSAYTQLIFEKAGGNLSPQHSSMIFIGLICILNVFCSAGVEKFGRKKSYFYSLLTCSFFLLAMALFFFLDQYNLTNLSDLNWFPLMGMVGFVITYSFGLSTVPTLMLGELFSASIKSKGLCFLMTLFGIALFLAANLFNLLLRYIGLYSPFFAFGICSLISTVLTLRWVPETKGKTLEEIQQSLKK